MIRCLLAIVLQLSALSSLLQKLDEGAFSTANFAFYAMYEDGEEIAGLNQMRKMNTASTLKAVTTGAALCALGKDYEWETVLASRGKVDANGTLHGDLYIIGGGDPMLGSNDAGAQYLELVYKNWAEYLKKRGIKAIQGNIIGDGSWVEGMREHPSWSYDDIGTYYGTCVSGLNFFENMQFFNVDSEGLQAGDKLKIEPGFPATPWMQWEYECNVGESGSGDKLYLYTSDLCEKGIVRGTYGAGRTGKLMCRNNYPERSLAYDFMKWLKHNGIGVEGSAIGITKASEDRSARSVAGELEILGSSKSVKLETVITRTNKDSNNMYAEMLARTLGSEMYGRTDPESAGKALTQAMENKVGIKLDPREAIIADACGLSTKDRVSAKWMCKFLNAMKSRCIDFDTYLNSLVKYSARCWYKTGSFSGCRCLCGYLLPSAEGRKTIVYCILVNNSELKTSQIDRLEKDVINALSTLN